MNFILIFYSKIVLKNTDVFLRNKLTKKIVYQISGGLILFLIMH
jgi:hypothetical protein